MIIITLNPVFSQITITDSDMPVPGDTVRYSEADPMSIAGYDFSLTGQNYSWDFSGLMHVRQDVDTFVTVLSTSPFYYPSFLPISNVAQKGPDLSIALFNLNRVYDFYRRNSNVFAEVGFAATFSGIPLTTVYSSPDTLYKLPLNFGDRDSSYYDYTFNIPMLFSSYNNTKRINEVDGWGTLITPYGSFQTIRLKSKVISRDSIIVDSLPLPLPPVTNEYVEYKWLANVFKSPVLVATVRTLGLTTVRYIDEYKPVIGVDEIDKHLGYSNYGGVKVFPNPSSDFIKVSVKKDINNKTLSIELYDLTGRSVISGFLTNAENNSVLDVSGVNPGLYQLVVLEKNSIIGCKKIIIQR